jgi:glycosyltransferase involved in cell wall biosynthesis
MLAKYHDVSVYSFRRQYPNWLYPGSNDQISGNLLTNEYDYQYLLDSMNPITWFQTAKLIRNSEPDLVLLQWWTTFFVPSFWVILQLIRRRKIVFIIHNVYPHEPHFLSQLITRKTLMKADFFILHSHKEVDKLIKFLPRAKIKLCPHPIYNHFPKSGLTRVENRKRLGITSDSKILLFFGYVRPYKGLDVLLDALIKVIEDGLDCKLIVAGEVWHDKVIYLEKIKKLGLHSFVKIVDCYIPDDQVDLYFSSADIYIAPYTAGTQSGSLTLALNYGLPIITTDLIGATLPSEIQKQITIVKRNDPDAIALGIKKILSENSPKRQYSLDPPKSWHELVSTIEKISDSID